MSQAMARRDSRKGHVAGVYFVPALIAQRGTGASDAPLTPLRLHQSAAALPVGQRLKKLLMGSWIPMNSVFLDSRARALDPWASAVLILTSRCCQTPHSGEVEHMHTLHSEIRACAATVAHLL